ncbi:MAG: DJ-1/PfpI family protein [Erysipelotrichaceae bacterium]|nr:DJ-1/PfpI family protein [Erysipelotrichaceae bacterium]
MKTMIIVSDGLEECEALVTYDLLFRAGIEVELVGLNDQITSSHKLTFMPHRNIDEIDPAEYECLILPGGMSGTLNLENDQRVQDLIDLFVKQDKYVCAICAAPSILIHKGLLDNRKFICFPGFENGLVPENEKAVQDGKFITGKGLGAAFEFSYLIIKNLVSEEKAKEVLNKIQY